MTQSLRPNIKPLTERQLAVLDGLAAGESNQQLAERLNLTQFTIKYHCRGIYQHFGVANRFELICFLLRRHYKPQALATAAL